MRNHTKTECGHKQHPDWNNSSLPWHESVKGKAWIKSEAKHLYYDKKLKSGGEGYESWTPNFSKPNTTKIESLYEDTDDSMMEETEDYFSAIGVTTDHTTPFTRPHTQNETVFKSVNYRSLLDSGATNADYVSENFCSELQDIAGYKPTKLTKIKVNSAILGSSVTIDKQIKFAIKLTSEDGKGHTFIIEARVAPIPYDLIIGYREAVYQKV